MAQTAPKNKIFPVPDGLRVTKDGPRYIVWSVTPDNKTYNHHKTRRHYLYGTTNFREANRWAYHHGIAESGWRLWLSLPSHDWNGVQQL